MLDRGLIGVCLAVALTGCMGRPPPTRFPLFSHKIGT